MKIADKTPDEQRRLEILRSYEVLDTAPELALDDLTKLAAEICDAPIAMISLVDEDRQWFKAKTGTDMCETPRDISFCSHVVQGRELLIVPDATQDERFADNPLVTGDPHICFYAGAPLIDAEGAALGSLCVIDHVPHTLTPERSRALKIVARQVMAHLELNRRARELKESQERLNLVTENARVGLVVVNQEREYTYANPAYAEILDLPSHDIVGKRVAEVLPAVYEDQIRERLDRAFRGERVAYELRKPAGGIEKYYAVRYEPTKVAGEVGMVVVVITDITEIKEKEAELSAQIAVRQQAEAVAQQFPPIIETSDDAIISKTLEGIITSWNPAAEEMFGYTGAEIIGKQITVLFPPERLQEEREIIGRIGRGERIRHFETVRLRKDGSRLDVSATISPIKNGAGMIIGASKILRDITERKRAQEQLLWKSALLEAQLNSAPDGILIVDTEGKSILQNQKMMDMWRFPAEIARETDDRLRLEWVMKQVKDPEKYLEKVTDLYTHPEEVSRDEVELVDGRFFERDSAPVRSEDGSYYGRIWVFRDSTERRRAQEQIAQQAALLDKARDAIIVRDLDGTILFWNQGAERMYGWPHEEMVGQKVMGFFYTDVEKFVEANDRVVNEGEWTGELQHQTLNRGQITVEARWTLIRDYDGLPKSILAINTDITDRKKIEAQFLRAQRMESIGTLAGGVAHDLNNILAPIMMAVEVLKGTTEDPGARSILDTLEVSARRGSDIVRQVLSFARGMEGRRVEVQPKHLLNDIENIIRDTFPKDIQLRFSIPADTWTILGDPTQMHQILLNLCVNARDAMPDGGSLTVEVANCTLDEHYAVMNIEAKPGRYVVIGVTDTGTGIPPAILDKIFEPFFTTKDINKGTGLGLSTVMAIVKSHEGLVNVYSEPGKGTTFKVYLPVPEGGTETTLEPVEEESLPRGHGETVLIVDDEASIRSITSQTLQAFGYRALTASDGAEAVAIYAENRTEIAVVLTDMMMPIMDGPATIRALTRVNPDVKIIGASGLNTSTPPGLKHVLTKPYTAGTLLKTLRAALTGG